MDRSRFRLGLLFLFPAFFVLFAACSSTKEAPAPERVSKDTSQLSRALTEQTLPIDVCGDGVVDTGESCDGGPCCTRDCKLVPADWKVICDPVAGTACPGSSPECPTNRLAQIQAGVRVYDPARGVTP
ncbi:MAG: hypothetical protein V1798_12265 [Pseudomonadota bacterium]